MAPLYSAGSEPVYHRIIISTSEYMALVHSYTVSFLNQQTQEICWSGIRRSLNSHRADA